MNLYTTSEWKKLLLNFTLIVRASLRAGDFSVSGRACIRELFRFKKLSTATQTSAKKTLRELQRRIHSDKTTHEPPQVKHLTRLLFTAMRHFKEAYCGGDLPEARPELADYPK